MAPAKRASFLLMREFCDLLQDMPSSGSPSGGFRLVAIDEDRPLLVHLKVGIFSLVSLALFRN